MTGQILSGGRVILGAPLVLWIAIVIAYPIGMVISFIAILSSLVFERNGYSAALNGFCTSSLFAGSLVGIFILPRLAERVGTARVVYWGIAISGLCCALSALYFDPWSWIVLRFILGVAIAGNWVYSEAWIVSLAPVPRRTVYISFYGAAMALGFFSGPLLIVLFGSDYRLMFLAFILFLFIFVIIYRNRAALPDLPMGESIYSRRLLRSMAILGGAAFVAGVSEQTPLALGAIWGLRNGWSEAVAVGALFAFSLGCAVWQFPIGWIGSKVGPGRFMVVILLLASIFPLLLGSVWVEGIYIFLLFWLWGGAVFSIYTLSLGVLGEMIVLEDIARANGLYIVLFSCGVAVGPPVTGFLMEAFGEDWLLYNLSLLPLVFLVFWLRFLSRA
ncbi:MAG: MFS transporter [Alphaproteobacteria bacterium]